MDDFSKECFQMALDDSTERTRRSWKISSLLSGFDRYDYHDDYQKYMLWSNTDYILICAAQMFAYEGIETPESLEELIKNFSQQAAKIRDRMFEDGYRANDDDGGINYPDRQTFYLHGKRYEIYPKHGISILEGVRCHGDTAEARRLFNDVMEDWERVINDTSGDD